MGYYRVKVHVDGVVECLIRADYVQFDHVISLDNQEKKRRTVRRPPNCHPPLPLLDRLSSKQSEIELSKTVACQQFFTDYYEEKSTKNEQPKNSPRLCLPSYSEQLKQRNFECKIKPSRDTCKEQETTIERNQQTINELTEKIEQLIKNEQIWLGTKQR